MICRRYTDVPGMDVNMEGARNVTKRVLAGPDEGVPNFVMRLFEVGPGGRTPNHVHEWEHEVFVLEGEGVAESETGERRIGPGIALYVPPGERHGFVNTGNGTLRFICVVPLIE